MRHACLVIPYPPSINRLWRAGGRGVHKSTVYRDWLFEAGVALVRQAPLPSFNGPVSVTVGLGKPDNRRRDIDNVGAKAILDLLVKHGVLSDDSLVQKLTMEWVEDVTGARVELEAA